MNGLGRAYARRLLVANEARIGYNATSKVGFYGSTPVVRPAAYTQTYSTTNRINNSIQSTAVSTTAATNTTPYGYTTLAQANDIVAQVNNTRNDVANIKQVLNSVIDDLQALGLVG